MTSSGRAAAGTRCDRAGRPDISFVILDLGLPDLDGLDVLEGLRARGSTVPVLVLSARGGVHDKVKGLDLGADDYLGKPFAFRSSWPGSGPTCGPGPGPRPSLLRAGGICMDWCAVK